MSDSNKVKSTLGNVGCLVILLLPLFLYSIAYFYAGYIPGDTKPHSVLIIRAEMDGKPIKGRINTVGSHNFEEGNLSFFRYVYYEDTEGGEITAFVISDKSGTELITIPASEIKPRYMLTINLNSGEIARGISFWHYFTGAVPSNGIRWIIVSLFCGVFVCIAAMIPVGFASMIISPFRKKPAGVKRRFSGSYVHMVFCFLVSGAVAILYFTDPEQLAEIFSGGEYIDAVKYAIYFYLIGTVLYPFAHRAYNAGEIRAKRRQEAMADYARANAFTYTVTKWTGGRTTSTYNTELVGRNIGNLLFWGIKMLLAPFLVYFAMLNNYLFGVKDADYQLTDEDIEIMLDAENEAAAQAGNGNNMEGI